MKGKSISLWLFASIWSLVIVGIFIMATVSVHESQSLMIKIYGHDYCLENNCNNFYFWRHIHHVALGTLVFAFGFFMPIRYWKKLALPMFIFSILILLAVLVTNLAGNWGTARSWINISFLPSIQPSEIAKISLIFYLAVWMNQKEQLIKTWDHGFLPFVMLMLPITAMIAFQPDFGSLMVIAFIAATMFFVAGGNLLHIFVGGLAAILVSLPVVFSHDYIQKRIATFLDPNASQDAHQVEQALITVGSGGLFGVGLGNGIQDDGHLPEAQSDFILAPIAEQMGFLRTMIIFFIYLAVAMLAYETAKGARNRFEMLIASGIAAWIMFQTLINIYVVLVMMPTTGITLPFISYGGSSMLTLLLASGILLRIANFSSENAHSNYRRRVRGSYFSSLGGL